MADHKVARSIEAPGGMICVDIFRRADGSWGFETYRRDPEEGHGWYPTGGTAGDRYPDEAGALEAAKAAAAWLEDAL